MVQLKKWNQNEELKLLNVKKLLSNRIEGLNLDDAIQDVLPFVKHPTIVESWSKDLFISAVNKLK